MHRRVLGIVRRPSWPPPPDAVTPGGAQAATEAFAARESVRPHDAALDFAWSTAATLEPWADGEHFFPRILADVEAARSSVHILMFGWREGEIGMRMAALLERKLSEGVEVRVIVDGLGSRPYMQAREMFTQLAAAGAEIVVNDVLPPERIGLLPHRPLGVAPGPPARPRRPSQAVRDRRARRLDRRRRHRGPLQRRPLPRPDGAGDRRRRPPGAGGVPDELPRPRRPAARRPVPALPRAARTGLDADRPRAGDPRRLRRRLAGRQRADRRGARAPRPDEPVLSPTPTSSSRSSPPRGAG